MEILHFLIGIAGAVFLLLYAVRMVRTGIERMLGAALRRAVVTVGASRLRAAAVGACLALMLQSSAAVALLAAGFVGAEGLSLIAALAVTLGGDLGSALLVQFLSLELDWLVPVLLSLGGFLFLKSDRRRWRQAGRVIMGVAFVLIALRFLRETVAPIQDSAALVAIGGWAEQDMITGFLIGAALAVVMFSSVAAVLICVALVGMGALPVGAGFAIVLGANLGSALIPVWLTRSLVPEARRVPIGNLLLRGAGALLALAAFDFFDAGALLPAWPPGQQVLAVHLGFNALLVLVGLPLLPRLAPILERAMPAALSAEDSATSLHRSVLDESLLDNPRLALASLRREVLRMAQVLEEMITPVMDLFADWDPVKADAIRERDKIINAALDGVRRYAARLAARDLSEEDRHTLNELVDYAIALEAAGDVVVKATLPLARERADKGLVFSPEGLSELRTMHQRVVNNLQLAQNVLISGDPEIARLLLQEKDEMRTLYRKTRKAHFRRLSEGREVSFESSDLHLETAHALKEFNAQITAVAYPILWREGQLLETRLIAGEDAEAGRV